MVFFEEELKWAVFFLKQCDNPQKKTIMRANCDLYHGFCNPVFSEVAYSLINQPTNRACFVAHGGTKKKKFQMHAWIPNTPLNKPACGKRLKYLVIQSLPRGKNPKSKNGCADSHTIRQCDNENSLVDFVGEQKAKKAGKWWILELAGDISLRC